MKEAISYIAGECDISNDGIITYQEALTCWKLGTTHEFILLLLLHGNKAVMSHFGVCGDVYAVQYGMSSSQLAHMSLLPEDEKWVLHFRILLAILNMVEALEITPWGTLYMCNMDRESIGLVSSSA